MLLYNKHTTRVHSLVEGRYILWYFYQRRFKQFFLCVGNIPSQLKIEQKLKNEGGLTEQIEEEVKSYKDIEDFIEGFLRYYSFWQKGTIRN